METPKIGLEAFKSLQRNSAIIAECAKCGIRCEDDQISASVEYNYENGSFVGLRRIVRATINTEYNSENETLHRICNVCGYTWTVPALDISVDAIQNISREITEDE